MQKVDANIILRYVLDDHADLSPKAKEIIDNHIVETPVEILCEVVYVLNGYYEADRPTISIKLREFFENTSCVLPHREAILKGLEYFGQTSFDFVDCILAGYAELEGDAIATFDNKLHNFVAQITNRR
jgi:predicted nucleic-acid-binding protein